jgi:hypothetical protein
MNILKPLGKTVGYWGGVVGTGYLEGIMILAKPTLHQGFANESDKKNIERYKFVRLIENEWSHE